MYVHHLAQTPVGVSDKPIFELSSSGVIHCTGLGALVGAAILQCFKKSEDKGRNAAFLIMISSLLSVPFIMGFLVSCPTVQIVGLNNRCAITEYCYY